MPTDTTISESFDDVEIQWSVYAEYYDVMCSINPAYDAMIGMVWEEFKRLSLQQDFKALDVGAGTGNLILSLASDRPDGSFTHLDLDLGMNSWAQSKYKDASLNNVSVVQSDFLSWQVDEGSFDVVMSTNALYAINPHQEALAKIHRVLKTDGKLLLVDFGRKQNTNDWLIYVVRNSLKRFGVRKTMEIVRNNWEIAKQNQRTTAAQNAGQYWVHETSELESALSDSGFSIDSIGTCYRGYSDIAICRKA